MTVGSATPFVSGYAAVVAVYATQTYLLPDAFALQHKRPIPRSQPWRRHRTGTFDAWLQLIRELLADGVARSFDRICYELTGYDARANYLGRADEALWALVGGREVEVAVLELPRFRRRQRRRSEA